MGMEDVDRVAEEIGGSPIDVLEVMYSEYHRKRVLAESESKKQLKINIYRVV